MKYYLIKEDQNYADEFDLQGFKVAKSNLNLEDFANKFMEDILSDSGGFPIERSFGGNDCIYIRSQDDLDSAIQIQEIEQSEFYTLNYLFEDCENYSFGTTALI